MGDKRGRPNWGTKKDDRIGIQKRTALLVGLAACLQLSEICAMVSGLVLRAVYSARVVLIGPAVFFATLRHSSTRLTVVHQKTERILTRGESRMCHQSAHS